ncbi:hypothetical protein Scep_022371 [Stephania cephalantha]|uniref:Uncharacterized protein n=1 Tax=Stephania cephalantha TaxID=152367 RepID=A0AAP0FAW3_9MAGN
MNSVHSNNEEVKRERQEEAAIAPPSSSSSSKQGDSTSAPKITMRDRDEVLEKLWSKYFERISRGEGSGHDSLLSVSSEWIEEFEETGLELFRGLFWLKLATMFKIIKEMLPLDVRVARDAQDLLVECCVGVILEEIHFLNNNNFTPYTLPGLLEWCTSENNRGSAVVLKNAGSLSSPKADISVL